MAGVLTEPARVGAMFRNTTLGTRKSSASSGTSRPLASCIADDVREVRPIPSPYRFRWAALRRTGRSDDSAGRRELPITRD
ncbi:hypothetical protein GCM10011315_40350 [Roseovarius pacificus]|nr:hypothetical protein GCM10011315_40350 [Roseovarius pacificus]